LENDKIRLFACRRRSSSSSGGSGGGGGGGGCMSRCYGIPRRVGQ